ncbi:DUF3025 domain-containing protein [Undibacterium pigrum]|uniref:DUF3025 family protein n=1 Tax=Undibacterium pigrum TaxID=401470 RepID=A0A318IM55_9BURK|nr:DUF3025 domain-containing protein [Undibacterium pigrum]PXX35356.1 hypothetical protein DFR42_12044 [Undibacterium pigrum]
MTPRFFDGIDWPQAWFAAVREQAQGLLAADDWRAQLNLCAVQAGLSNHRDLPLRFITQEELPEGEAYEAHISATGLVPTRENLHDFFNALVWLTFPAIKRQLNALQAAQIASLGIGKSRGPARDAATIFDENAALLVLADTTEGADLIAALRAHAWQDAFVLQADKFGRCAEVWCFGHALMEKLVQPYKAITAHTWVVMVEPAYFTWDAIARRAYVDAMVAQQLASQTLTTANYTPLPVLGLPGWWHQQDTAFYEDQQVFRAKRRN